MAWTSKIYVFGGQATPTVQGSQNGTVLNVPADNSAAVNVTFPTPYTNACTSLQLTVDTGVSAPTQGLDVITSNRTKTGFTVNVLGGSPGATVTVDWLAAGN